MTIRKATDSDLSNLCSFNTRIYPDKQIGSQQYLDFWISKGTFAINKFLLLLNNHNEISGQILASEFSYYYKQKKIDTVWLFDLIIDKELRKTAWGIDLLLQCMDEYPFSCSTGSGPTALPIHLKLGNSLLGELRKYVGIVNPINIISSFHKDIIQTSQFPFEVIAGHTRFRKVEADQLQSFNHAFNPDLFEPARDKDYIMWRFFNQLHQYAFYLADDGSSYFVLRSIKIKGFRVMELVDFRCLISDNTIETIFQAAKNVTRKTRLAMMVWGSTLAVVDNILEKHHFRCIGRPRPVLGFLNIKDRIEDIRKRNFCFVTFADSDGETNNI